MAFDDNIFDSLMNVPNKNSVTNVPNKNSIIGRNQGSQYGEQTTMGAEGWSQGPNYG